jgi:thiol-disulfide isomerase/thioredoxin
MKKILFAGLVITLLTLSFGKTFVADEAFAVSESAPGAAAQQLLTLELPDERGKKMALRQWQGNVLVINFWATWCPPCKEEIPVFSRLHATWRKKGVQFVGIAMDNRANVQAFVDKAKVSYPQLIGDDRVLSRLGDLGNDTQGLPFTLITNRRGEIFARRLGVVNASELEELLRAALLSTGDGA